MLAGKSQLMKYLSYIGSCLLLALAPPVFANTLEDISFSALSGDRVQIVIKTGDTIESYRKFTTDNEVGASSSKSSAA